jgi:3-methylfumaryl-CoA hydratase
MLLITVRHDIYAGDALAISEEQDIVYREAATGGKTGQASTPDAPPRAPPVESLTRTYRPEPAALFRYSALTFNAHRIHYDRDYATTVEGYGGLVVHGPFVATLLLDHFLVHNRSCRVDRFTFRARQPLLDTAPFILSLAETSTGAELAATTPEGALATLATVEARR